MKAGSRCVRCEFAVRKQQADTEDPSMTRTRTSAPPAIDVADDADDEDPDDDAELLELDRELHTAVPPPPQRRGRAVATFKPGTRQPAPAVAKPTGEPPWWAKTKPGEMTKTAEEHRQRMAGSKEAKKVPGFIND